MTTNLSDLPIKNSWEKITIAEFMMIEDITSNKNYNALEKMIKTLAVLCGVGDEYFNKFRIPELTEFSKNIEFLKQLPETKLQQYYTIGGKEYKFLGNFNELTTGQFIDLNHFTKEKTGILDNLHIITSIFLMPVIKKTFIQKLFEKLGLKKYREYENYMETPLEQTAENIYNHMLYQDANAIALFFCVVAQTFTAISVDYLKRTKGSLLKQASKMLSENLPDDKTLARSLQKVQQKIISLQNGDGSVV